MAHHWCHLCDHMAMLHSAGLTFPRSSLHAVHSITCTWCSAEWLVFWAELTWEQPGIFVSQVRLHHVIATTWVEVGSRNLRGDQKPRSDGLPHRLVKASPEANPESFWPHGMQKLFTQKHKVIGLAFPILLTLFTDTAIGKSKVWGSELVGTLLLGPIWKGEIPIQQRIKQ